MLEIEQYGEQKTAREFVTLFRGSLSSQDYIIEGRCFEGTYVSDHENRPQKDAKHEAIILEVNVIHDEESGVQKEGNGYNPLNTWVYCTLYKSTIASTMQTKVRENVRYTNIPLENYTQHKLRQDHCGALIRHDRPCTIIEVL